MRAAASLHHGLGDRDRVELLGRRRVGLGGAARREHVVDDPGEPLGLLADDRDELLVRPPVELRRALERHRGAVHRGERRA